jgi:hypothetical protein
MKNIIFTLFGLMLTCSLAFAIPTHLVNQDLIKSTESSNNSKKPSSLQESMVQLNSIEVLIKDSDFKKAKSLFKSINLSVLKPEDQIRYYFFKGMIFFEAKRYDKALVNYESAYQKIKFLYKNEENDLKNSIITFMAQAHYALKNYARAISALNEQKQRSEKSYLILSSSYWALDKKNRALTTLNSAISKFPRSSQLIKQKAIYYSEFGLLHEIYLESLDLIANKTLFDQSYYLFLVSLLKQKIEINLAQKSLENAVIIHSQKADLISELAYIYYAQNKTLPAKDLYLKAATLDLKYAYAAAEVLLKNNDLSSAKYFNSLVLDQKKKIKQLFAIEIKMANFEEAYFLKDELNRQGLLADESLLYALAYCSVKVGKIEQSRLFLDQIKNPDIFKKALKLKDWSKDCLEEGAWKCLI